MRAPDLHAPRCRYKVKDTLSGDFIKKFREKHPQYSKYSDKVIKKVIKKHNQLIWKTVLQERDGIELQGDLGHIFMGVTPPLKHKAIAYKESIALGVKVYYNAHETDGKTLKIHYSNYKSGYRLENKQLWEFTAVRQFKRAVHDECPQRYTMYLQRDPSKRIWQILEKRNHKDKMQYKQKEALKEYNEFELD